ncbi:MAG: hypothetical protein KY445_14445 [Armatimonadetes bacterium]|nr:hypothetical protein [Armatimonadota bacterium]
MTKKTQVARVKWTTFWVVFISLLIGLTFLRLHLLGSAGASPWIGGFVTVFAVVGAQIVTYFVIRLVPGTQKPRANTELSSVLP